MNKSELIDVMAEKAGLTKADAARALEAFISATQEELAKDGGTVVLVGFGAFEAKTREARKGRNPQTGAELEIKASRSPSFKAGKKFKDSTNTI